MDKDKQREFNLLEEIEKTKKAIVAELPNEYVQEEDMTGRSWGNLEKAIELTVNSHLWTLYQKIEDYKNEEVEKAKEQAFDDGRTYLSKKLIRVEQEKQGFSNEILDAEIGELEREYLNSNKD